MRYCIVMYWRESMGSRFRCICGYTGEDFSGMDDFSPGEGWKFTGTIKLNEYSALKLHRLSVEESWPLSVLLASTI